MELRPTASAPTDSQSSPGSDRGRSSSGRQVQEVPGWQDWGIGAWQSPTPDSPRPPGRATVTSGIPPRRSSVDLKSRISRRPSGVSTASARSSSEASQDGTDWKQKARQLHEQVEGLEREVASSWVARAHTERRLQADLNQALARAAAAEQARLQMSAQLQLALQQMASCTCKPAPSRSEDLQQGLAFLQEQHFQDPGAHFSEAMVSDAMCSDVLLDGPFST